MENQAEKGGGKIKKRSSKTRKPYSRPPKKSIFTRVTDSVKNLFSSHWFTQSNDAAETSVDADTEDQPSTSRFESPLACPSLSTKRKLQENIPSPVQKSLNQDEFKKVFGKSQFKEKSSPFSLERAETSSVASSSGCSSQPGSRSNLNEKPKAPSLWSSLGGSTEQPTERNGPVFNSSLLASDVGLTPSAKQSSFYSGRVSYGGAMNQSRNSIYQPSPYKIPQATKVQVRSKSRANESSLNVTTRGAPMSSTARKILTTLEKMSTPLNDAKRIVTHQAPINRSMLSRQSMRRKTIGPSILSSNKPPTTGMVSMAEATKRVRSPNIPLSKESATWSIAKRVATSQPPPNTDIPHGPPAPIASLSSSAGMRSGGKMVRKTTSHYSTKKQEEEDDLPPLPLPSVPLTLSSNLPSFNFGRPGSTSTPAVSRPPQQRSVVPKQPMYQFASPTAQATLSTTTPTSDGPTFRFSSPNTSVNEGKKMNEGTPPVVPAKPSPLLKKGGVMDILGNSTPLKPTTKSCEACETPKPGPKPITAKPLAQTNTSGGFMAPKMTTDKWECDTCMIMNANSRLSCEACQSPKPGSKSEFGAKSAAQTSKVTFSFGAPKTGEKKWECDGCMLMNDPKFDKCPACTTPRPGASANTLTQPSKGFSFGAPAATAVTTVACTAPKPGSTTSTKQVSSEKTSGFKFGGPVSQSFPKSKTWECMVCMLHNTEDKQKCAACETTRPGAIIISPIKPNDVKASDKKLPSWECDVCMVQNKGDCNTCIACTNPKPGQTSSAAKATFKFGFTSAPLTETSKDTSTTKTQFKFGVPTNSTPAMTKSDNKPSIQLPKSGGFKFGVPAAKPSEEKSAESADKTVSSKRKSDDTKCEEVAAVTSATTPTISGSNFGIIAKPLTTAKTPIFGANQEKPKVPGFGSNQEKPKVPSFGSNQETPKVPMFGAKPDQQKAQVFGLNQEKTKLPNFDSNQEKPKIPSFGSSQEKPKASMFGSNQTTTFGQPASLPTQIKVAEPVTTVVAENKATAPTFSFGNKNLDFGANQSKTTEVPKPSPPSFSFGSKPANPVEPKAAPFVFGAAAPKPDTSQLENKPAAPTFAFGSSSAAPASVPQQQKPKTGFNFGQSTAAANTTALPTFQFGASQSKPTNMFQQKENNFGSNSQAAPAFGSTMSKPAVFQFGAKENVVEQKPTITPAFQFGATAPPIEKPTTFQFAQTAPTPTPSTFVFGNQQNTPSAGFQFGAQSSSGMFANTQPVQPPAPQNTSFAFGASQPPQNSGNTMFSIGTASSKPAGRSSTPVGQRTYKKANRRLKKP
uniref:Nuclear pore complex protein Nup153 n=1 Tax=Ciona intestinalis TaxID=7719 RepID=F6ZT40_CIOIN